MIETQVSTAPGPRPRRSAAKRKAGARKPRALSDSGDRRASVLAAAQRVFEAQGLDGANMRAIAKEAGYTVGALYFYYASREEIYADLLSTSLKHLQVLALEAAAGVDAPADRAVACALAFYDYYATRPNEFSLAFYLFRGIGPHGLTHDLNARLNAELWATLSEVYRPLVETGRNLDEALRDLTACFGHAAGLLLLTHTGRIRMFRQDGRELFRALWNAGRNQKGRRHKVEEEQNTYPPFSSSAFFPMAESFRTRLMRWRFNWHPAYRRSGGRIEYVDETLREVRVRLPLNRGTRNLNGTIYGGSIYAAVDPIHAVMLVSLLGPEEHVAWTKEATVRFRRQARTDLTATVRLDAAEVDAVRAEVGRAGKVERRYTVELCDARGFVCADCDILVHIHTRQPAASAAPSAEVPALA